MRYYTTAPYTVVNYGAARRAPPFRTTFTVPAGTSVMPARDGTGDAWVDDFDALPASERFDAFYYGVRIPKTHYAAFQYAGGPRVEAAS